MFLDGDLVNLNISSRGPEGVSSVGNAFFRKKSYFNHVGTLHQLHQLKASICFLHQVMKHCFLLE